MWNWFVHAVAISGGSAQRSELRTKKWHRPSGKFQNQNAVGRLQRNSDQNEGLTTHAGLLFLRILFRPLFMAFASIYVPDFSIQAVVRAEPALRQRAIALIDGRPPLERVVRYKRSRRAKRDSIWA